MSPVHNHGPDEGKGMDCRERWVDGRLRGECMDTPPVPLIDLLTAFLMQSTARHIEEKAAMDKRFLDAVKRVDEIQDSIAVRKLLGAVGFTHEWQGEDRHG